jgi:hypothetical protein
MPALTIGQPVTVKGERAIVIELSDRHDWVNLEFPDRRDGFAAGGWVDPKNIKA